MYGVFAADKRYKDEKAGKRKRGCNFILGWPEMCSLGRWYLSKEICEGGGRSFQAMGILNLSSLGKIEFTRIQAYQEKWNKIWTVVKSEKDLEKLWS